jgi:hypothetical protein
MRRRRPRSSPAEREGVSGIGRRAGHVNNRAIGPCTCDEDGGQHVEIGSTGGFTAIVRPTAASENKNLLPYPGLHNKKL